MFDGRTSKGWQVESDRALRGTLDVVPGAPDTELSLSYALAGTPVLSQYVALVAGPLTASALPNQVTFNAHANGPMRISVGVRSRLGEQWSRSAYLDGTPREQTIRFDEMAPIGTARSARPVADEITDVLFVIETTHNRPGARGWLRITSARLQGR